jgi:hypothetical protein
MGKIYEVKEFNDQHYEVMGDKGVIVRPIKSRFEPVEEVAECPDTVRCLPTEPRPTKSAKAAEMDFFRTSAHPENCSSCGSPRPCAYHPN